MFKKKSSVEKGLKYFFNGDFPEASATFNQVLKDRNSNASYKFESKKLDAGSEFEKIQGKGKIKHC